MRKITALAIAGVVALSGCALQSQGPAAAVVGGHKVTQAEAEFYSDNYRFTDNEAENSVTQAINSRIVIELCDKMGIETDDDDDKLIKSTLISLRKEQGGTTEFDKYLKEKGLNEKFVKDVLAADVLKDKLQEKMGLEVTDDEIKDYYNTHYYRAKHILIMADDDDDAEAKAKAEGILARVNAGEDFDKLMNEYTEDPGTKNSPDGYTFTDGEMVSEFENTVKALEIGKVEMCKSNFGYHIIKRLALDETTDIYNAGYDKAKSTISTKLMNEKFMNSLRDYADQYKVKIKEDDEKKAEIIENIKQERQAKQEEQKQKASQQ